jgi:ATP-dependent DNA ligase
MEHVMLASPMSALGATPEQALRVAENSLRYVAELKLDGIRCQASRTGADVVLRNRRGDDITHRYPDVVEQVLANTHADCTVDGEIIVTTEGRITFAGAHKRDAQDSAHKARALAKSMPAQLIAFDIVTLDGNDLTAESNQERRDILVSTTDFPIVPRTENIRALWDQVVAQDFEGIVVKDVNSRYTVGRARAWVKIKRTHRVSVLVAEADQGSGHRGATFGALRMQLWDTSTSQLVDIGRVGSGFTHEQTLNIAATLADASRLPFVAEVEYLEVAPTGQLRQPVFRGVRSDIDLAACTTDQLRPTRPA